MAFSIQFKIFVVDVSKRNSKAFHLFLQSDYKLTFQNVLSKFGSARYKFGRSYQASSGDKVQKVIKYIDKVEYLCLSIQR
jgi:hypothetical protein